MGVMVAPPAYGVRSCIICALPAEARQEVNAAIWDGQARRANYRAAGKRTFERVGVGTIGVKTVTAHADHIEASWRKATPNDPAMGKEEPVFATDYESLSDRAAMVSAQGMTELEKRVIAGSIGDRELVGVVKMGLTARQHQEKLKADAKRPQVAVTAIIGLASGHFAERPEAEAIEVFDESTLKEKIEKERRLLTERARGGAG